MRKFLLNLLTICISILIALLFLEIVLRCIGFSYPSFYIYDRATGSAHRPGASGWWREEGEAFVEINGDGMRDDREISKKKPSEVYRIAVLGDSFAEAFQVDVKDTFWRILENKLNDCSAFKGKKIEVLNFGVAGYSTAQELLSLRSRVWDFQPDMVLLAFLSGNDVRDNHPALCQVAPCPFFIFKNGSLMLDDTLQSALFRIKSSHPYQQLVSVLDHLRVYQFAKKAKRDFIVLKKQSSKQSQRQTHTASDTSTIKRGAAASGPEWKQPGQEIGLDNHIYFPPQSKDWDEAWRITEALIVQMHAEVVQHGARFFLVSLTNSIQVNPDPKARNDFADRTGSADLLYPDKRIQSFATANGIESFILAPIMQKYAEQTRQYFHGFPNTRMGEGHWNEKGHRIAGEAIAQYLCKAKQDRNHE